MAELFQYIPYNDVVEVEQELIAEGMTVEEVLRHIEKSGAAPVPKGHPVDLFMQENRALEAELEDMGAMFSQIPNLNQENLPKWLVGVHGKLNNLSPELNNCDITFMLAF